MAKLKGLSSRLRPLRSSLTGVAVNRQQRDQQRDARHWRRWYKTARWQRVRMKVLVRDHFTCQWPGCGRVEPDTSQLVADHREQHRGDEHLFWDEGNLWCLCKPCHDSAKQREEARER